MATSSAANRTLFESAPIPRALATMAIPTIISQLIALVYNLADAYFVGRVGNAYMIAAISLIYPVFAMTAALANLFGVGGGSLIARLLGAGKEDQARQVSVFSVYAAVGLSLLFSLVCLLFLDPLLVLLGASADTTDYARQYMFIVVILGTLPTVLSSTMAHLVRNVGYSRHASFGLSLGAVLNVILDPLFMFVLLPQGQELFGAALATTLSNFVSAAYFLIVFLILGRGSCLSLSPSVGLPSKENIRRILSVGLPSAITVLLYDISNVCLNAFMATHGDHQLAALGIILKAERIPLNIGVGICQGMLPLVAYNYSAGNHVRMKHLIHTARLAGLGVAAFSILFYEVCAGGVIQAFISTSAGNLADAIATVAFGAAFLRRRCLASPFAFMNFHITYSLQAMGDGKTTLRLAVLRQCIIYIPIMTVMNLFFGAVGLVWAQVLAESLTLCIAFFVFNKKLQTMSSSL